MFIVTGVLWPHYDVHLVEVWIYKHAWTALKAGCSTGQCWDDICDIVHNYSRENPTNTRRWSNDGIMFIQSRRRWASSRSTYCICWEGGEPRLYGVLMLAHCLRRWPSGNRRTTLGQHWISIVRTLGICQTGVCLETVPCLSTLWMLVDNIIIYFSDVLLSRIIYTWYMYTSGLLFIYTPGYIKPHLNFTNMTF